MKDYSFLAAQIRAARAILGWSQTYLAKGANVTKNTIVDLEANRRVPHEVTLMVVLDQLTAAGLDFTEDGVKVRDWPLRPYVPVGVRQQIGRSGMSHPVQASKKKSIRTLVSSRTGKKL